MIDRRDPEDYELESFQIEDGAGVIHLWLIVFAVLISVCLAAFWLMTGAEAHDAPSGWTYSPLCCSNRDCGLVPADWIEEGPAGVRIVPTGEVIPYSDTRIKQSPDGEFHWCRPPNEPSPHTICIYLPSRGA